MKIFTKDGVVCANAETMEDIAILLSFTKVKKLKKDLTIRKEHKKHNFPKQCGMCGRICKGVIGLGIHQAKCRKDQKNKNAGAGVLSSITENNTVTI